MKFERNVNLIKVRELFKNKDIVGVKDFLNALADFEVTDIIEILEPEKQVVAFRLLSKAKALHIFESLDVYTQHNLLRNFSDNNANEVFAWMQPDDRIKLLEELPAKIAKQLLVSLSDEEREMTSMLLGYALGSAGHSMTPKYIRLRKTMTCEEALHKIRSVGSNIETINQLYVTDDERKLEGVIALSSIVLALPETNIEVIMMANPPYVTTSTSESAVVELLKASQLLAVPVVDSEHRLVGVITIDDAMDILEEEATDVLFDKVGFVDFNQKENDRSRVLIEGSFWQVWRVRIPFLIITLVGGMMAGGLISFFEASLEAVLAVAFFLPVVMDMGGNVGTQSSTIFARALVLGHIDHQRFIKHWLKEIALGASMGIILGVSGGLLAFLWQGMAALGLVVGISLFLTITIATALGFLIPFILVSLNFDQAAGADPIITTLKDISGLAIYFLLVNHFLH